MRRPELALQIVVAAYLEYALPADAMWTAIDPGDVALSARQASLRKRRGVRSGWPDLVILYRGRLHGIELKAFTGRLSSAQRLVQNAMEAAGGVYSVCRSLADVEAALILYMPLAATTGTRFAPRDGGL